MDDLRLFEPPPPVFVPSRPRAVSTPKWTPPPEVRDVEQGWLPRWGLRVAESGVDIGGGWMSTGVFAGDLVFGSDTGRVFLSPPMEMAWNATGSIQDRWGGGLIRLEVSHGPTSLGPDWWYLRMRAHRRGTVRGTRNRMSLPLKPVAGLLQKHNSRDFSTHDIASISGWGTAGATRRAVLEALFVSAELINRLADIPCPVDHPAWERVFDDYAADGYLTHDGAVSLNHYAYGHGLAYSPYYSYRLTGYNPARVWDYNDPGRGPESAGR